jgi:hypothetical protein
MAENYDLLENVSIIDFDILSFFLTFFGGARGPPQRGLEGKTKAFGFPEVLGSRKRERKKKCLRQKAYKSKMLPISVNSSFCIKLIWLKIKIYWKM